MRRLLLTLMVPLVLSHGALAQADPVRQTATPSTWSRELAEANELSQQAIALYNDKKYSDAVSFEKRALAIREEALGPDHELVALSLNNLGEITLGEGRYSEAETYFKRSLAILEKRWGREAKQLIKPIEGLALTQLVRSDFGESEKLCLRAFAIKEKVFGPDTLEMSQALEVLGSFYDRAGKTEKAVDFYMRSLAIREKVVDTKDHQIVSLLRKCACSLVEAKRPDEARKYMERAEKSSPLDPQGLEAGPLEGYAIYRFRPNYPPGVVARGVVVVRVLVNECGRVLTAQALSGPPPLKGAAEKAAYKWRFAPIEIGGRLVRGRGEITFNFTR